MNWIKGPPALVKGHYIVITKKLGSTKPRLVEFVNNEFVTKPSPFLYTHQADDILFHIGPLPPVPEL